MRSDKSWSIIYAIRGYKVPTKAYSYTTHNLKYWGHYGDM